MELDVLKDALVGAPGQNGLSVEARKRLSIAVEQVPLLLPRKCLQATPPRHASGLRRWSQSAFQLCKLAVTESGQSMHPMSHHRPQAGSKSSATGAAGALALLLAWLQLVCRPIPRCLTPT